MEIYIEDVFLDNFLIDLILLWCVSKILKFNTKVWKLLISAFIGVALTVLSIFVSPEGLLSLLYKILCGTVMMLIISPKGIKKFLGGYFVFLALTFLMGGVCTAIALSFGSIAITESGQIAYTLSLPMGVIIGIIFLFGFLCIKFTFSLKNKLRVDNFIFSAEISSGNAQQKFQAFLDTGCRLCDPTTSKPVIFISYPAFQKMFDVPLSSLLLKKPIPALKNMHYITAGTIGSKNEILVFDVDNLRLDNSIKQIEIKGASLALTFSGLEKSLDCALLFGPKTLNGD